MTDIKVGQKITVQEHPENDVISKRFIGQIGTIDKLVDEMVVVNFGDNYPYVVLDRSEVGKPSKMDIVWYKVIKFFNRLNRR